MTLKEAIKEDIDTLQKNELVILLEQINQFKKRKKKKPVTSSLSEIHALTSTSKSNWAADIIQDRKNR
jgi:hypothetical protein